MVKKLLCSLCIGALAIGVAAAVAAPTSGGYRGALYDSDDNSFSNPYGKLTFKVSGQKVRNFNLRGVTAFCFSGFTGQTGRAPIRVNIDSIKVRGNRFKKTHVWKTEPHGYKVTTKLTGRFSGKTVKGTFYYLSDYPYCEAKYDWKAKTKG